ncbi:ABC transporter ATP-binding protein [Bacillus sp. MUM 13]|uniref:ABC transporter ATP-binding protein n=1 Tax=Bacillus sp. MUM 13 TaxID=1678001 RepID=UPI0008F5D648|nr:ABC transporter ATP-binding protein [Bacillus sp. MUM 13]OIK06799.1 hypothetical protein BIV59_21250 [Bacillus sp. MUM 13]
MKNLKWIWTFIKQQKLLYFSCIALLILEVFVEIYSIKLQQYIIDEVIITEDFENLWIFLPLILLCYLIFTLLFVINPYIQSKIHGKVKQQILNRALWHFYNTPLEVSRKERDAKYVHYFSNEIPIVARVIGEDIADIVKYIFSTLIICSLIIVSAPVILIAIVIIGVLYIAIGRNFNSKQKEVWKNIQEEKAKFLEILEEGITSTRDVIASNRTDWEQKRFNTSYNKYFQSMINEGKLKIKQVFSLEPLTAVTQLLVLCYGGFLVFNESMSIGTLVIIFQLTSTLLQSFIKLYNLIFIFSGKLASVDNIRMWLDTTYTKREKSKLTGEINELKIENVNFHHNKDTKILNNITLEIPIGKKVAIVGASGSGKSTIASLLTKFLHAQSGKITVNGHDLNDIGDEQWRERVSIVFQDGYIFHGTIRDNLLMGRQSKDQQLQEICKAVCINDMIENLPEQYDSIIGERGVTISGGERQRLSLARALIKNPEILVLDESTSALDVHTEKAIQENIDLIRNGKTTIIIAHRLSTIRNADIIFVVNEGKVIEKGTHQELITRENVYANLINNELQASN